MNNMFDRPSTQGFTLVEVVITLGVFVIVTAGASALLITSIRSNDTIWEKLTTQHDGRQALQEVLDDVRRAEVSSIGSYPVAEAAATELVFYANVDNDPDRERVAYWLSGEALYKGVTKPTGSPLRYTTSTEVLKTMATGVKNTELGMPVFLYYGESYTGTSTAFVSPFNITDVRMLRISLELDQPKSKTGETLSVESLVHIRNLKEN